MSSRLHTSTVERQRVMLRTAMGPSIASALSDPAVIEVMVNPDGRLWLDRHGEGRVDTGQIVAASEVERIIRLVASHIGRHVMGVTMGLIFAGHSLGGALGSFMGGYLFELFARYDWVWIVSFGLAVLAGLLTVLIAENRPCPAVPVPA